MFKNIDKYGYNNVRGGKYVNSKTLKKNSYNLEDNSTEEYDFNSTEEYEFNSYELSDFDDY